MGLIKINNEIYGTSNASDIVYKDITVEEKLDTIPIFDINDNGYVDNSGSDYLTYGHIIDSLTSNITDKVLSANQGKVLNESINSLTNNLINLIYPVGSIYMSVNNVSPASFLGGTWEAISTGRTLFGVSGSQKGGDLIEAGLPNITGSFKINSDANNAGVDAHFSGSGAIETYNASGSGSNVAASTWNVGGGFNFDASKSYSIYGASTTVQPPAVAVYIWKRIS